MSRTVRWTLAATLSAAVVFAPRTSAQGGPGRLPRTRADVLLDMGEWSAAEDAYYGQSRAEPRAAVPRAALGRYLAMKGAVRPGTVLIEEAMKFGLDSTVGRAMLAPWRSVLEWRSIAVLPRDSVVTVRAPRDSSALFQMPIPRSAGNGAPGRRALVWADVVPRLIGVDSLGTASPRVGIELLEAFVPSYDVATRKLTLHADPRSASKAPGRRYPVLRDARGVKVLMTPGRALPLATALQEMEVAWWQLDLPRGVLVVR